MQKHIVSDGTFRVDGGTLFARLPRTNWDGVRVDQDHRVTLSLDCLLLIVKIRNEERRILVNTGIGPMLRSQDAFTKQYGATPSRLRKSLRELGVSPQGIHLVLLTSLRFPDAGGCTRLSREGKIVPAFRNATYVVHEQALEEALRVPKSPLYDKDVERSTIQPLVDAGKLTVIQENFEVVPGIRLIQTDGPCQGHLMVVIELGAERILFTGGILPTIYHLSNFQCVWGMYQDPQKTLMWKEAAIKAAAQQGFLVVFPYGVVGKYGRIQGNAGYIEEGRNSKYGFREASLEAPSRR